MNNQDDFSRDNNSAEYSYYPADVEEKKKGNKVLKVMGAILCVAAISAASIGCYIGITGNDGRMIEEDKAQMTVSGEANSETDTPVIKKADDLSFIQVAGGKNALTIPEIIKKVNPSVVGVTSLTAIGTGTGTGIIITEDGYIVTNAHVVMDNGARAKAINVVLSDKTELAAEIIGTDPKTDLAVIKVEKDGLKPAVFGDSDKMEVGELVIAIGNPLGLQLSGSVSHGIISALDREITIEDTAMSLIQTDAAINPGNSGGPLVNCYGEVIGINSAKIAMESVEGIGFAIPIDSAIPIVNDLIKNGYVTGRPQIGITGQDVSRIESRYYRIPEGVLVRFVESDSGAYRGGVKVGDIIISADDREISTMAELNMLKDKFKPGETFKVTVWRDGIKHNLDIILSEAKS